jgi:predicted nucleotidyltransferase
MEKFMGGDELALLDLDHVVMNDGQIYRVVGNLDSRTDFLGYNVYSPSLGGDRLYRGEPYTKNFIEDDDLPSDVLDTYELLTIKDVAEHHDPVRSARLNNTSFRSTVWHDLYAELICIFGEESVGIFGSSMFGLHLTPEGKVRKDIDFVIQGMANVEVLRHRLPEIRDKLGFTSITAERQLQQYARYQRVFRNENNSIMPIIARRWTGLQLSEHVVTTVRLRDPAQTIPVELVTASARDCGDVIVSGRVADADGSNLFPRRFTLVTDRGPKEIYIFWWKFSTPVRDGDAVTLCGSLLAAKIHPIIRLTDFTRHWLRIND